MAQPSTHQQFELDLPIYEGSTTIEPPSANRRLGVRYIGSKTRIASQILEIIGTPLTDHETFVDPFCGSGAVSRAAADFGWRIIANDLLVSSTIVTAAFLSSEGDVEFKELKGYQKAMSLLDRCRPVEGTIFNEYSPSGGSHSGHTRRYFTEVNASKIDGIREAIKEWRNSCIINRSEETLLLADLLASANAVANIAGTYGCFMKEFLPAALSEIKLTPRKLRTRKVQFSVSLEDANDVWDDQESTLYLDPPYTKRQYAAYYHVLETIAVGDYPKVGGVTGLRPWKDKSSDFCHKKKALGAFKKVLDGKNSKRIFISYNSDGHLQIEQIADLTQNYGNVRIHNISTIPRYSSNRAKSGKEKSVVEFLIEVNRK